jgi:hypothetical protein
MVIIEENTDGGATSVGVPVSLSVTQLVVSMLNEPIEKLKNKHLFSKV